MNENVTIDMEREQESGQITYANEVIATIVSVATTEVEGISGIAGAASISGLLAKGKTPRSVKVNIDGQNVGVDVSVTVDYGMPIQKVGRNAQENVRKSIESMTGLHVDKVDMHVVGVSFEKENQELQAGQKLALNLDEATDETPAVQTKVTADETMVEEPFVNEDEEAAAAEAPAEELIPEETAEPDE